MTAFACPHCNQPLRDVEEIFGEWEIHRLDDGTLVRHWIADAVTAAKDGYPVFDGGLCVACGEFVNERGGTEDA